MKLIIAYVKPFKLEAVKEAVKALGVTGMSVSDISGFGRQSGQTGRVPGRLRAQNARRGGCLGPHGGSGGRSDRRCRPHR